MLALDPEDIHEGTDTTTLMLALKARITDLEDEAAIARLEADRAVLSGWLSGKAEHPAVFIEAWLEPCIEMLDALRTFEPPDLATTPSTRRKRGRLEMDGPAGLEAIRIHGALIFHGEDFAVTAVMLSDNDYQQHKDVMQNAAIEGQPIDTAGIDGLRFRQDGKPLYYVSVGDRVVQLSVEAFRNTEKAEEELLRVLPSLRIV